LRGHQKKGEGQSWKARVETYAARGLPKRRRRGLNKKSVLCGNEREGGPRFKVSLSEKVRKVGKKNDTQNKRK